MEALLTQQVIKAIGEGNLTGFLGWAAIFILLWVQLRGLKKALEKMNETVSTMSADVAKSFAEGETRFDTLEKIQLKFEHRLTVLERNPRGV